MVLKIFIIKKTATDLTVAALCYLIFQLDFSIPNFAEVHLHLNQLGSEELA